MKRTVMSAVFPFASMPWNSLGSGASGKTGAAGALPGSGVRAPIATACSVVSAIHIFDFGPMAASASADAKPAEPAAPAGFSADRLVSRFEEINGYVKDVPFDPIMAGMSEILLLIDALGSSFSFVTSDLQEKIDAMHARKDELKERAEAEGGPAPPRKDEDDTADDPAVPLRLTIQCIVADEVRPHPYLSHSLFSGTCALHLALAFIRCSSAARSVVVCTLGASIVRLVQCHDYCGSWTSRRF